LKIKMAFKAYIDDKSREGLTLTCAWCDTVVVNRNTDAKRPAICLDCFQEELIPDLEDACCASNGV